MGETTIMKQCVGTLARCERIFERFQLDRVPKKLDQFECKREGVELARQTRTNLLTLPGVDRNRFRQKLVCTGTKLAKGERRGSGTVVITKTCNPRRRQSCAEQLEKASTSYMPKRFAAPFTCHPAHFIWLLEGTLPRLACTGEGRGRSTKATKTPPPKRALKERRATSR